jgi:hypothetical protein
MLSQRLGNNTVPKTLGVLGSKVVWQSSQLIVLASPLFLEHSFIKGGRPKMFIDAQYKAFSFQDLDVVV